jgi:hypothetical protein
MATATSTTPRIELDWSRLLGFDQAAPADTSTGALRQIESTLAKVGAKVGVKPPPTGAQP